MFTLCGLILEARENLFRNFWSPFSISFYFSSERNKKTNRLRAVPERDTARGQPLNSAAPSRPSPSAPPQSVRAAGAAGAAADDRAARGSSRLVFRAEKKSAFVVFLFLGLNP